MKHEDRIGILAFVPDLWGSLRQSRHHVLERLSQNFKVLWVSPPIFWQQLQAADFSNRGLRKISDSFWAYAPIIPADYKPSYYRRGLIANAFRIYHAAWCSLQVRKIHTLLWKMGVTRVILYLWRPEYEWTMGKFSELGTAYHIDDEYSFNPTRDMPIGESELNILKKADLVFIHSRTLMEKKGHLNANTHYVPNGVDFDLYQAALQLDSPEPSDIAFIPHPRVGYMGHIKRHIDLPLLLRIAKARRDWSLVMIGPVRETHSDIAADIAALRQQPNVYFLGGKPAADLPVYVNALDVCLMCYRQTNYTKYIYPMKMHEYFACGKPVVATPLDNLQEFSNVLLFAQEPQEWLRTIEHALSNGNEELRKAQVEIARQNSWQLRVEKVNSLLEQRFGQC